MTTITVYQNDKEVVCQKISQEYYIVETSQGELIWYEKEQSSPGVLKIWLHKTMQANGSESFLLRYVLPDWQLIIDGVWMEKKFYEDIEDLFGKILELQYKDYRFVFQFN